MRQSIFRTNVVTYAAIGGTRAANLMTYPPSGFRPFESRTRLGAGQARFETATRALMTWGVQRGSGILVTEITEGTGENYPGIAFASDGSPRGMRRDQSVNGGEHENRGIDGIRSGMSAVLVGTYGPFRFRAPVRIVYVTDDENRKGFAYGTLPGHPLSGEEAFSVERYPDDSVWITIRSFYRTVNSAYRAIPFVPRIVQRALTNRYSRALLPARIS